MEQASGSLRGGEPKKTVGRLQLKPLSSLPRKPRIGLGEVSWPKGRTKFDLNKTDEKYYIGPSDRIGCNYSPAVEGLQQRGKRSIYTPPALPFLDHIINPQKPTVPVPKLPSAVPNWRRPNNLAFGTRSKSNAGAIAALISDEHRVEIRTSRFKYKHLDPETRRKVGPNGTDQVTVMVPPPTLNIRNAIRNFRIPKGSPETYHSKKTDKYGTDLSVTELQNQARKLHNLIINIGIEEIFGNPGPPLGDYEWIIRVLERIGLDLNDSLTPVAESLLWETSDGYRKAMASATIRYLLLTSNETMCFGLSASALRPMAIALQNSTDVSVRATKALQIAKESAENSHTTAMFSKMVGRAFLHYDPFILWMHEMWSDPSGMLLERGKSQKVSFDRVRLTIVEDANFSAYLPIHPLVYKEKETKRRMRVRFEMWQTWRKKIAYALENRVLNDLEAVNAVRAEIQEEIDGRGIQPCDANATFSKFYKTLTKSETTYVAPKLILKKIKHFFPEKEELHQRPIKPRLCKRWREGGNKVCLWPITRIRMLVEKVEALMMVQVQEQTAASLKSFAVFFERYTTAAGIPKEWHVKQSKAERAFFHIMRKRQKWHWARYPSPHSTEFKMFDKTLVVEDTAKSNAEYAESTDKSNENLPNIVSFFEPYCTGYEMPIFIPAFTCEVTVVSVLDESYRLYTQNGQQLPFSLHPPFAQLEKLLQNVVTGIVDCSQMYPAIRFSEKNEEIVCGIPDAAMEAARAEKAIILKAQQMQIAEQAMEEAAENGEEVDPEDYLIEDESDDDNEDEEEEVGNLRQPVIPGLFLTNSTVKDIRSKISRVFKMTEPAVNSLLMSFASYAELFEPGVDKRVADFAASITMETLPECYYVVHKYMEMREAVLKHCRSTEYLPRGLVEIQTEKFTSSISQRALELARIILESVKQKSLTLCLKLDEEYIKVKERLAEKMNSSDEIYDMRVYIAQTSKIKVPFLMDKFNGKENGLINYVKLLIEFAYRFEENDRVILRTAFNWSQELQSLLNVARAVVMNESEKYFGFLKVQRDEMDSDIKTINSGIKSIQTRGGLSQGAIIEMNTRISGLRKGMKAAQELAIAIKHEERNLGQPDSDFSSQLDALDSFLVPLESLWSILARYQGSSLLWYHTPIASVNSTASREEADTMIREFQQLIITEAVEMASPSLIAAKGAVKEIEIFLQEHYQLLTLVATPGLTKYHWNEISLALNLDIEYSENMTLDKLISHYHLHKKTSIIEKVCLRAHQEWDVHLALESMQAEWDEFQCETKEHEFLPQRILDPRCDEDIELQLDEQALRTKSLSLIEAALPHIDRVKAWMLTIDKGISSMQLWRKLEEKYFHLASIFVHKEVKLQLSHDSDLLDMVKTEWDDLMEVVIDGSVFNHLVDDDFRRILEKNLKSVSLVENSLLGYLQHKRSGFPRFYFLSDEEIMQALADSMDRNDIQRHFQKVFDGLIGLQFGASELDGEAARFIDPYDIIAMLGDNGQNIGFKKRKFRSRVGLDVKMKSEYAGEQSCYINPKAQNLGIDIWLAQVEQEMFTTIRETIDFSFRAYSRMPAASWFTRWPVQVVLVVKQTMFTSSVEKLVKSKVRLPSCPYQKDLSQDMNETIKLLRSERNLMQWNILNCVITLQVSHRDVFEKVISCNVESVTNFNWISHIRHYYTPPSSIENLKSSLNIALLGVTTAYGNEYLKSTSRLVLTPLTLKCFRSLSIAATMNYFGALHGPGGVGKTETVKDFNRLMGRMCLVINCSNAVTARLTGRIIKGLAATPVAVCFDDFNRMDMRVVSVVAQQLGIIRRANKELEAPGSSHVFDFEGEKIRKNGSSYMFLTMNTMTFEKHVVPVSFKTLFRDITLTQPNYTTICEAALVASGFYYSHDMARLITTTYDICADAFCSESSHDWSLRPMRAIFKTAADEIRHARVVSKDLTPSETISRKHLEKKIIYQSLLRIHGPQFNKFEETIFRSIADHVFCDEGDSKFIFQQFDVYKTIEELCRSKHFLVNPTRNYIHKVVSLFESLYARRGLLLIGRAAVGKTTSVRLVHDSLPILSDLPVPLPTHFLEFVNAKVDSYVINSKAYSYENLYGRFHSFDNSWVEGSVEKVLTRASQGYQEMGTQTWLVFDGPIDTVWMEYLNSALDDTSRLSLANGKFVNVPSNFRFIFESSDIFNCTPASISRCGTVCITENDIGWESLMKTWLQKMMVEDCDQPLDMVTKRPSSASGVRKSEKKIKISKRVQRRETLMLTHKSLHTHMKLHLRHDVTPRQFDHFCAMFEWLVQPVILLFETELKNHVVEDSGSFVRVHRLTTMIDTMLRNTFTTKSNFTLSFGSEKIDCVYPVLRTMDIECVFVQCLLWSFGCDLNLHGREIFSRFLVSMCSSSDYIYTHAIFKTLTSEYKWSNLGLELEVRFPADASLFDLYYHPGETAWKTFTTSLPTKIDIPLNSSFRNIVVPTSIGLAFEFHVQHYLNQHVPLLLYGCTGSGKSTYVNQYLQRNLDGTKYMSFTLHFTSNTNVKQTKHDFIEHLDKPQRGSLAPRDGLRCICFIDDMHMVRQDENGVQPANELIRSVFDSQGWYNDTFEFQTVKNVNFIASVTTGTKKGDDTGRFSRLSRHFNVFRWTDPDEAHFEHIYSAIVEWYATKMNFKADNRKSVYELCEGSLVKATIHVYKMVSQYILPSPSKPLNIFNPRDIGSVVQGILLVTAKNIQGPQTLMRLWTHEVLRVFFDRLSSETDMKWLFDLIKTCSIDYFGFDFNSLFAHLDTDHNDAVDPEELRMLYFGGFAGDDSDYKEIYETDTVIPSLENHLASYNKDLASHAPMNLVIFSYAAEHISRILRTLRMPGRHGMLVGIVGSGRQSLTKLAAYISNRKCLQICERHHYKLEDWKADLKKVLWHAGIGQKGTVFLINHTQLVHDEMYGDLDVFLRTGTTPGLFEDDELHAIYQQIIPFARESGFTTEEIDDVETMLEFFFKGTRECVTVILCFSPLGDGLRRTLHEYTGIASCCTIDWYEEWPIDALSAMAHKLFDGITLDLQISEADRSKQDRESSRMQFAKLRRRKKVGSVRDSMQAMVKKVSSLAILSPLKNDARGSSKISSARMEELKRKLKAKVKTISLLSMAYFKSKAEQRNIIIDSLVEIAMNVHLFARDMAEKKRKENHSSFRKITYVTPRNYLDLLTSFKSILRQEQLRLGTKKRHYESGVSKIDFAASEVEIMREEINEITPVLIHATEQTAELLEKLDLRMPTVLEARTKVQAEEKEIRDEQDMIEKFKKDVEKELAKCRPQLAAALKSLDTITQKDIALVKTMKNPAQIIKDVLEAVCLLLGLKPHKTKTTENYWKPSVKLLNDKTFIQTLKDYDKENIKLSVISDIRKRFLSSKEFNPERVKKASSAAEGICKWVIAIAEYDKILRSIRPKQKAIKEAEEKLVELLNALHNNQMHLRQIESDISSLEKRYGKAKAEKEKLHRRIETCTKRVKHAEILLEELGGERELWFSIVQQVSAASETVIGDMFSLSTIVAYSGAASSKDRYKMLSFVKRLCHDRKIPATESFTIRKCIGDETQISRWNIAGLPDDTHHIENAIILHKATLWPLLIDPHGIGSRWIKNLHSEKISSAMLSDTDFLPKFENAIEVGLPFLIERVPERLPNDLDPILYKQAHVGSRSIHRKVKIGDREIEWNDHFQLVIATELHDPHFLPTVSTKVCIMDFSVTPGGMEENILNLIVGHEHPDLASERMAVLLQVVNNREQLKQLEEHILKTMAESMGNILDDEKAIAMLRESQQIANTVAAQQEEAKTIEGTLEDIRRTFIPAAEHGRVLYFVLSDMDWINSMYRFSIEWFNSIYKIAVKAARRTRSVDDRVQFINQSVNTHIYRRISSCFAASDRFSFAMCFCIRLLEYKESVGFLSTSELQFLLKHHDYVTNAAIQIAHTVNPGNPWLHDEQWALLKILSEKSAVYQDIQNEVTSNIEEWRIFHNSPTIAEDGVPGYESITQWEKMLLLKCIRPDSIIDLGKVIISQTIGDDFLRQEPLNLDRCFKYSAPNVPLIFVLSGSAYDPTEMLRKYAKKRERRLNILAVHIGRERYVEKIIRDCAVAGEWVLIENCHLLVSWLPRLEQVFEEIISSANESNLHEDFRIWCSSEPCESFPVLILQEGIKMMIESPTEFRHTLVEAFNTRPLANEEFWELGASEAPLPPYPPPDIKIGDSTLWKRTAVMLCCLHANMVLRGDYGGIGWNCPYTFGTEDLNLSLMSMKLFGDANSMNFESLRYCVGECLYGGKFNDPADTKLLSNLISWYINEDHITGTNRRESISLSSQSEERHLWLSPDDNSMTLTGVRDHIKGYPKGSHSDVIGLDVNAVMIKKKQEAHNVLHSIMLFETQGGHDDTLHTILADDEVRVILCNIIHFLPNSTSYDEDHDNFRIAEDEFSNGLASSIVNKMWPLLDGKPQNAVMRHEVHFYKRMLNVITTSVFNAIEVLEGKINPSGKDKEIISKVREGNIANFWVGPPYQSTTLLWSFLRYFKSQVKFFINWACQGHPSLVWLGAFAFPRAYLSSLVQEKAFKDRVSSHVLELEFIPTRNGPTEPTEFMEGTVYLTGFYLESATWRWPDDEDDEDGRLVNGDPIEVYTESPILRVRPVVIDEAGEEPEQSFELFKCPLYKTFSRVGRMSTHGTSDNLVTFVTFKTDRDPHIWSLRGAALLMQIETELE